MTTKCEEHETLCDSVKKMEGNTLQIAISASDTARAVEKIMTNHLPHIKDELTWTKWIVVFGMSIIAILVGLVLLHG